MAENCSLVFCAMLGLAGRTVIETRFFASTVAGTLPVIVPEVAVMVTDPTFLPVASPLTVIEATVAGEELHATLPVMSCAVSSENVPLAVNCCTVPSGMDAAAGVTLMEVRVALVMVRTALEETVPEVPEAVAVMVELPGVTPIASPGAPFTLMLTAEGFDDVQVTKAVTFCMLPSVMVPVAVNCTFVPCAILAFVDETASDLIAGAFTVRVTLPVTPEREPVIVAVPCAAVETTPAPETVATVWLEDIQVTVAERSLLVPSLYFPVAVSWSPRPAATEAWARAIWIDFSVGCVTTLGAELVLQPASKPRHKSATDIWNFFINFVLVIT